MTDSRQRLTETELVLLQEVGFILLVPEDLRELVCRMFRRQQFAFGDEIVHEGDEPDSLFVLTSGSARVVIRRNDVDVMLGRLDPGAVFGEAALMAGAHRAATVRASEDVEVLRLPREAFDALVDLHPEIAEALSAHMRMQEILRLLRLHPAFSALSLRVLSQFLPSFETLEVASGAVVVHEGNPANAIYAVVHGRLTVSQGDNAQVIGYLRTGDFFGEAGLLENAARRATVTAAIESRLLRVDADAVRQLQAASPRFAVRLRELADQRDRRGAEQVPLDFVEDQPPQPQTSEPPEVTADAPTPTSRRHVGRGRRFPFVAQFDAADCGVACLAMVARHFGRDVSVTFLRDAAGTGTEGTTLTGIVEAGHTAGLSIDARRTSLGIGSTRRTSRPSCTGGATTGSFSTISATTGLASPIPPSDCVPCPEPSSNRTGRGSPPRWSAPPISTRRPPTRCHFAGWCLSSPSTGALWWRPSSSPSWWPAARSRFLSPSSTWWPP